MSALQIWVYYANKFGSVPKRNKSTRLETFSSKLAVGCDLRTQSSGHQVDPSDFRTQNSTNFEKKKLT